MRFHIRCNGAQRTDGFGKEYSKSARHISAGLFCTPKWELSASAFYGGCISRQIFYSEQPYHP